MAAGDRNIDNKDDLQESVKSASLIIYRSTGLGLYGAMMRFIGMPLEKIALYTNSAQVSGQNQLRQAMNLAFQDGQGWRSFLTPYKVVGPASGVAWFLQYSVMGMVFQVCDKALSRAMDLPAMPYGSQLMEDPQNDIKQQMDSFSALKACSKIVLAPTFAGIIESTVANRAEAQRYFGITKFSQIESALKWNPVSRLCGPAFFANASRNVVMSSTSFVITPTLYRQFYPQEQKSQSSLFWFGLGVNIFIGNVVAITQQALWGRALDYASSGRTVARNISYRTVIQEGFMKEGRSAFFTVPKWASRVLMNAPVQGTLPWFYNEVLPLGEDGVISSASFVFSKFVGSSNVASDGSKRDYSIHKDKETKIATSPFRKEQR